MSLYVIKKLCTKNYEVFENLITSKKFSSISKFEITITTQWSKKISPIIGFSIQFCKLVIPTKYKKMGLIKILNDFLQRKIWNEKIIINV